MKVDGIFNIKSEQFFCALMNDILFFFAIQRCTKRKCVANLTNKILFVRLSQSGVEWTKNWNKKQCLSFFITSRRLSTPITPLVYSSPIAENRSKLIKDLKYIWRKHITTELFQFSNVTKYHQNWLWWTIQKLLLFMFCLI